MNAAIPTSTHVAVTLFACLAFVAAHDGAGALDRGYDGGGFVVHDHCTPVIVRDHWTVPVIRDHRTPPIVRDRRVPRGPQGGVNVTSSGSRRGGSPCIRSVFGSPASVCDVGPGNKRGCPAAPFSTRVTALARGRGMSKWHTGTTFSGHAQHAPRGKM
jgi:hypothetical protein